MSEFNLGVTVGHGDGLFTAMEYLYTHEHIGAAYALSDAFGLEEPASHHEHASGEGNVSAS